MARSVAQFLNRNAALQGLKYSTPQAALGAGERSFQPQAASARNFALQQQINQANTRGSQATQYAVTNAANKARAAEEARQAKLAAERQAQQKKMQDELTRLQRETERNRNSNAGGFDPGIGAVSGQTTTKWNTGSDARDAILKRAESLIGTDYAWGGGGYNNRGSRGTGKGTTNVVGVDCSGLTSYAYSAVGVKLPRVSDAQLASGYKTRVSKAKPGDLIGWGPGGHVAIYAGNGEIIEAVKPGVKAKRRRLTASDYQRGVYAVSLKLPGE